MCRIDDANVHVVRRRYADGGADGRVFEHLRWNGGTWSFAGTIRDESGVPGSGVVLLTNGTSLLVGAIANDATRSMRYATWQPGGTGAWSDWSTLSGGAAAAQRHSVSSSGCADPSKPAITWTEGPGPLYRVVGVPVIGLMP